MSNGTRISKTSFSAVAATLFALTLAACGSHPHGTAADEDEPIKECDSFLASYEHCLDSLGPHSIAEGRVAQTRAGFVAAHGAEARAALRQKCVRNLEQLKTTCR